MTALLDVHVHHHQLAGQASIDLSVRVPYDVIRRLYDVITENRGFVRMREKAIAHAQFLYERIYFRFIQSSKIDNARIRTLDL